MPDNTTFTFNKTGGMAPTWFKITITDLQIFIEEKTLKDKTPKKWVAEISQDEKEDLYQVFYENKFDLVKTTNPKESFTMPVLKGLVSVPEKYLKVCHMGKIPHSPDQTYADI
jgi:hypothetical protein